MIKLKPRTLLLHLVLIVFALIILGPMVYTFLTSLKLFRDIISGSWNFEPTSRNYEQLFMSDRSNFTDLTRNSLVVGVLSLLVVQAIAALGAYSMSRFRWRKLVGGLVMGWLLFINMLPPIIFVGPFFIIARTLGFYDTPIAITMAHSIMNLPLAFWMLHSFFADIPIELEEAAAIDGCSRLQTFLHIALPIAKPGIAATSVLVFVFSWKEFLFALTLSSTPKAMTIPVGIAAFAQEWNIRYGEMAAAAFFATIPALFLVFIAQKHIVKGMTLGALKG
ncbi:MAG: carbohydrate ABC transporter permease [Anaerolineae bacterium]|nr:carbohydrate ABC transporter permease [Anaerolineae bacterium]